MPTPYTYLTPMHYGFCDTTVINAPFNVTYDPAYPAPTSYQWTYNGLPVSTGTTYTATDTGKLWVHINGPYGCPALHEATVNNFECEQIPLSGGLPGCPNMEVTFLRVDSPACANVYVRVSHNKPNFSSGEWKGTLPFVDTTFADTTAWYRADSAGVYTVIYRANYRNTAGQLSGPECFLEASRTIVVPIVAKMQVTPTCSLSGTQRVVRIKDLSSHIIPITRRVLYLNGTPIDSNKLVYDVPMTINTIKTFRIMVNGPGSGLPFGCNTDTTFKVPGLPKANYNFLRDTTCEKDAAVMFTDMSSPTGLKTLWDFNDGSQNEETNPQRVYNSPPVFANAYDVRLVVTDPWGCTDDTTRKVPVKIDQLNGNALITPRYPCQYSIATAVFQNTGTYTPTSYDWYDMSKNKWATYSPFNPIRSGGYFVHVEDKYGCYHDTKADTVTFIRAPRAVISGSKEYCRDKNFTLSGYVGIIPGLSYQWERNDTVISGAITADLIQNLKPGNYKFNVTTTTPNPVGGFCSNRSDDFFVKINDTPVRPLILPNVTNCNDYTVRLAVTNQNPAFIYNWSNGMSGAPVFVKHGGHYEVIVTDLHGCENKGQVYAPKDPREYLWIFPTGCYSLCSTRQNIIVGPIIPFTNWNYKRAASVVASGSNSIVGLYNINTGGIGVYTMFLQTGACSATSKTMTVDFDCTPGGPGIREPMPTDVGSLSAAAASMFLAPNPAMNITRVTYSYLGNAACYLQVYDMVGKVIYTTPLNGNEGVFDMDLSNFTPGIYKVAMRQGGLLLKQATLSITR